MATQTTLLASADKLNEAVPSTINLPLILATLQKIADESQVVLGEFSLSPTTSIISFLPVDKGDKLTSFQFNVNLSGTFENMEIFIDKLGLVSPILRIEKIVFAEDKTKAAINFYFSPVKSEKQDVTAPLYPLSKEQEKAIESAQLLAPPALEEFSSASSSANTDRQSPFR